MPADATYAGPEFARFVTLAASAAAGELRQLADGMAAFLPGTAAAVSGDRKAFRPTGLVVCQKTAGVVLLDGGRAYWDHSANVVTFRKVGDRDFYLGRVVGDAASADTTCTVNLNADPAYDLDLARDPYLTAPTGTQALGGFLPPQQNGGSLTLLLSSTNEVQKCDALGVDTFSKDANAIVEMAFRVVNDGAGAAADFSLGIASGTHATDADSIANHLLVHLDANATAIKLQSKDGTTTVTATDTLTTYAEGSALANRKEVWFDLRNPADVQVYVDGVLVLGSTVFDLSAAANEFRLLAHLEKTASADQYEVAVDWLRARFAEQ